MEIKGLNNSHNHPDVKSLRQHYEDDYPFSFESIDYKNAHLRDRLRWIQINANLSRYARGQGDLLLDVGCGGGAVLRLYGKQAIGIDISSRLIRELNKSFKKEGLNYANFVVADAEYLPFKEHSIDLVVCSETVEHLPHPDMCVGEIERVINNFAIITVPNMFEFEAIQASGLKIHDFYHKIYKFFNKKKESPIEHFYREHLNRKTLFQWKSFFDFNGLYCLYYRSICLLPYLHFFDKIIEMKVYSSKIISKIAYVLDALLGGQIFFNCLGQYTLFVCETKNKRI